MLKTRAFLLLLALSVAVAQVNTSTMDGLVTDPQGALIGRSEVAVTNTLTGQVFRTITDDKGHWAVPALPTGHLQRDGERGRIQEDRQNHGAAID
jgi:Carboxypeptidase regulatory-like domain